MITVKTLKKILDTLPEETTLYAYEGEVVGIIAITLDGKDLVIYADCDEAENEQPDFPMLESIK